MHQGQRILSMAFLTLIWALVAPALFIMLYTVIETQAAARAAVGADAKLAPYTIRRLANELQSSQLKVDTKRQQLEGILADIDKAIADVGPTYESVYSKLKVLVTQLLVGSTMTAPVCDSPEACMTAVLSLNTTRPRVGPEDALDKSVREAQADYNAFVEKDQAIITFKNRRESLERQIRELELRLNGAANEPKSIGEGGNAIDGSAVAPAVDTEFEEDARAVALNYNEQRKNPLFEVFFFLPSGVVVAFFTSLMGAIGAAIYSLMRDLQEAPALAKQNRDARSLWQAYGATPLLGGLAGFTVFFVVSAGTSFLIQPGSVDGTEAVNQLSPAALASLGAFAGLVAERAMKWLIEKAEGFFKLNGNSSNGTPAPAEVVPPPRA